MEDLQEFIHMVQHARGAPLLTPLQVHEIEAASRMAEAGVSAEEIALLKQQRQRIEKHWTTISGTAVLRGSTSYSLCLLANSFVGILIEDYWNMNDARLTHVVLRDVIKSLGTPEQRQAGADAIVRGNLARLDGIYEARVVVAMNEFMVDRQHIEDHFRAALRGEKLTQTSTHGDQLRSIVEKDRATLRQFVPFFEYDKRERPISFDKFEGEFFKKSEERLKGPSSASEAYSSGSSFWSRLGLGAGSGGRSSNLTAIASLLRSDGEAQRKKKV